MLVPKGQIVNIAGIATGVLSDDVTITLQSEFADVMASQQNDVTHWLNVVGACARDLNLLNGGFSSQFKQYTTQVWQKSNPASFSLLVEFNRIPVNGGSRCSLSGAELVNKVRQLCYIPLPKENEKLLGNLIPPGPSLFQAFGKDKVDEDSTKESLSKADDDAISNTSSHGIVNVTIGKMVFRRLIMTKAVPTFSKWVDDEGYPISCRVDFDFKSVWAATQNMLANWWN
jgi:hypothetical protein